MYDSDDEQEKDAKEEPIPKDPSFREVSGKVFRDEREAARFWLEQRTPLTRSPMDPRRLAGPMGRSTIDLDVEAVLRSIERGLEGIPPEWHPAILVHLGWRIGIRRLRTGDYLCRAGLPSTLPQGLTQNTLTLRSRQFRQRLSELNLIDRDEVAAWTAIEEPDKEVRARERPISGWKGIATHLGVAEITAKRWEAEGLPVCRPSSGMVLAFPSALNLWVHGAERAPRHRRKANTEKTDRDTT